MTEAIRAAKRKLNAREAEKEAAERDLEIVILRVKAAQGSLAKDREAYIRVLEAEIENKA